MRRWRKALVVLTYGLLASLHCPHVPVAREAREQLAGISYAVLALGHVRDDEGGDPKSRKKRHTAATGDRPTR